MVAREEGYDIEYPCEMPPSDARRYAREAVGTCVQRPRSVKIIDLGGRVEAWTNGHIAKEWMV